MTVTPNAAVPRVKCWLLAESTVRLPASNGAFVNARFGPVIVTRVRLTSKLAEPLTMPKASSCVTSPATRARLPLRVNPAVETPDPDHVSGVALGPEAWLTWIRPLVTVALSSGPVSVVVS